MYVRTVQGKTLRFGHRGWLLDESFIFYDKQFDSLWVQATGACIDGKFKGERLETIPSTHTTWSVWQSMHPDTVVLAKPRGQVERYRRDSYEPGNRRRGVQFGLAVHMDQSRRLYPLRDLERSPLVHDRVGSEPVLIVYHRPSQTALAFDPRVDGEPLEFELIKTTESDLVLRDRSAGGFWSGMTGHEIDGERQLQQLQTSQFVLSNWHNHFPEATVFAAP